MSALVVPVVRVPSCARGPPGVLITAHLHMYNKSVLQYCRYIKNDDHHHHHHEPRTKFHLTSLGARAMHGFGAEVFIEEVQCYDDMMIYSTGVSFLA